MNRTVAPVLVLLSFLAAPSQAQTTLSGVRNLAFGVVPVGVTTMVLPTDPIKSGQWTVNSQIGRRIFFRLTLPNVLNGPAGATLPVNFQNGDAFILELASGQAPDYFNPGGFVIHRFTRSGQAIIRLGGRATPAVNQRSGSYSNTAIMTIWFVL